MNLASQGQPSLSREIININLVRKPRELQVFVEIENDLETLAEPLRISWRPNKAVSCFLSADTMLIA